ncbi:hypothetical protein A2662_00065 [Candidatus Giovannonibacteria bacterium RIFCSPHIGHO2_01_FULL_45_33]|uniref:Uncharacterized protein n=1 Tax=Candidatus Giovannonibacteria bacterium RIFCSPLOWO2_01_FULL_45_34 TaxID=1798351 RepID=A0A1F5WZ07_9BACT|nr:MAG: hypothetical protein A2662_00065 [Candidatus Giovannonibacteria bacterium RIFCSPHIGHO2_01_FULL_45_33]OGF69553.1 MAG: hypothetical protein A3C73_01920 [Candidatus Giovannonibacteria bacterium RIFCSPHIGHO2_02_FULL_44_11]OGF80882.1 MAG: hypothetical protein A2930_01035 [Candidatus Giovannonibacteria bacterium RIFCSPLOWO2_01_FULL_45_34]
MTKREQIELLLKEGKKPREIHEINGFSLNYAYTVSTRVNYPDIRAKHRKNMQNAHAEATVPHATRSHRQWNQNEKIFLLKNGKNMRIRDLAIALGRTYYAVQMYACKQGIDLRGDKMGANANRFKQQKEAA